MPKSITALKSLEKQDIYNWPTVNLFHGRIKDKGGERLLKTGAALNNAYRYAFKHQMHLIMRKYGIFRFTILCELTFISDPPMKHILRLKWR